MKGRSQLPPGRAGARRAAARGEPPFTPPRGPGGPPRSGGRRAQTGRLIAPRSIRTRLLLAALLVVLAALAAGGLAVQRAYADSVRTAFLDRLQSTVYLLLAAAEIDASGRLRMPAALAEPRLGLPGSGLYAAIRNPGTGETWHSPSALGVDLPALGAQEPGAWSRGEESVAAGRFLVVRYGVRWSGPGGGTPLVLAVMQDKRDFARAQSAFVRTLWSWLAGAGLLLLLAQAVLLHWGLAPLRRLAQEVRRVEAGEQDRVAGDHPEELQLLAGNLNTLIEQERGRRQRSREALGVLAHSLKTPLAVLRNALGEPAQLPAAVAEQVQRMDAIVQHQLGRAAASGANRFAAPVAVRPVLERLQSALGKVHAARGLAFSLDCPAGLSWRIDEADLYELLGNLLDNAAKWARGRVAASAALEGSSLVLVVEDDGPGFPDTEAVLRMHVRLDERVPGHGIGLAVVKDLVDSHLGQLRLDRSPLGGGRVRIVLPRP